MGPILAATLLAALVSFLLGRLLIRHASRLGLQDLPNARSSHLTPKPRGGGIGIVAAFLVALPLALPAGALGGWNAWLPLAAALMLALVGLADDLRGLGLAVRLGAQCLAVAALLAALGYGNAAATESDIGLLGTLTGLPSLAGWLSAHASPAVVMALDIALLPLVLLGGLWWINLFNFMDGIDGLAASQALFMLFGGLAIKLIGSGLDVPQPVLAAPASAASLLLAGSVAGFLVLNRPPARLFMGDSGSLFLGFCLFALAAHDVTCGDIGLWSWLTLGSLFLADATVTLIRRWITGQRVTAAHRSHLYQRLSRRWGSHAKVCLVYFLINLLWAFPLAILAHRAPQWAPMIVLTACVPAAVLAWRAGAGLEETENGP